MKMNTGLFAAIAAIAAGSIFYFLKKNRKESVIDLSSVAQETVDSVLQFDDVVGWFKGLNLKEGEEMPFIAQSLDSLFGKRAEGIKAKEGYKTILLGVYTERTEVLSHSKILFVKDIDSQLKETLGKEKFVVLS
ncbi:MAG: hypothetical protein K6A82_01870 [Prevotella sp.]|nr:hypothetical protein [Prevotella sp.]